MGVINLSILVEKIKRKLLQSGFVTNTDYASGSKGGVFRTSANYGSAVGASGATEGILMGVTRTQAQYESGNNTMLMSKGTLENTIAALVQRELVAALGGANTDPEGTTLTAWKATKGADGWTISSTKS